MRIAIQDVRYALRLLWNSSGFTIVAALTLGLAIGANTAIFSLVNGVLLRPLPYPDAGQLVRVFSVWPTQPHFPMAVADFIDYRQRNQVFSNVALYAERDLDLTLNDRPEHLTGMGVTYDYFRVLGYHPELGRDFEAKEEYKGNNHVVLISDRLWRSHFGSDPNIVGRGLELSAESFVVIGVMPPGIQHVGGDFHTTGHGDNVDLWWPLPIEPANMAGGCDRGCHFLNMIARLKAGVGVARASVNLNSIADQLSHDYPDSNKDGHALIVPLKEEIVGRARLMLAVLLGAVGFLLLIACVNVANLSLARATARYREIAIRSVLGAGRFRIVRQLLTESLLLSALGCFIGLILARWGVDALVALSPDNLPRLQNVHVDGRVLLFAILVTVGTAIIFGLAPAITILRADVNSSLKDGDRGSTGSGATSKLRDSLVTAEIALALVLLAGAGLLMRTFMNLQHVDAGFQPAQVLTFHTDLAAKRYPNEEDIVRFYQNLAERLKALPGVQIVGESSDIPWTGYDENTNFDIVGRPKDPNHSHEARYHFASPDYFRAIGTPLVRGRFFAPTDDLKAPKVILMNSALAQRDFPNGDAVGQRLDLWGSKAVEIVGIIGDVKDSPDAPSAKPALYWNDRQVPGAFAGASDTVEVVRANSDLNSLGRAVRTEVLALDKDLPVTDLKPMDEVAAHSISGARFTLLLVSSFGGLALLLAGVGIFGLMSFTVAKRTHEIGIRMALGAQQRDVLKMVVSQGARMAGIGVGIGFIVALGLTRAMAGLLYGVSAFDPWTFAGVAVLLTGIALLACYLPARRASKVDPMVALRYE